MTYEYLIMIVLYLLGGRAAYIGAQAACIVLGKEASPSGLLVYTALWPVFEFALLFSRRN